MTNAEVEEGRAKRRETKEAEYAIYQVNQHLVDACDYGGNGTEEYAAERARQAIAAGANVNYVFCDRPNINRATRYGYTKLAKVLVEHGAKVNVCDAYGDTPLHAVI